MRWRIYYADGSTFSSDEGEPKDSPPWGAVLVTQRDVPGMDVLSGEPFFVHRADLDLWLKVDEVGLMDQMAHFAHVIDCVRPGRWAPVPEWKAICRRADEELGRA